MFWSSLVLIAAGAILTTLYTQASERAFDERLLVFANGLAADLVAPADGEKRELGATGDPRFEIPLSGWYWQVGGLGASPKDTKSSRSLVGNALPALADGRPDRPFGEVRKATLGGLESRDLRIVERDIDLGEDGRFVVRVAGPADEISAAVDRFVVALVVTFVLLGLGLGLSTLLQVRFGLRPLGRLGDAVTAVRRGDSQRIAGVYPPDVAPLADELNLLIDANREILDRARTQVGNLAHALKTPLSVIVNEADAPGGDIAALVREQAALMRDQVEYYLKRARTAALAGTLGTVTEARPVLEGLVRTFEKILRDSPVAITLDGPPGPRFRGERQDLEEMAGNLLDNACKWAVARVVVSLASSPDEGPRTTICLAVEDDGPGMPEAARNEALKRGRRLDETKPGSGLGLSIVSELAGSYGGHLLLSSSASGGLRAELHLPGDLGG